MVGDKGRRYVNHTAQSGWPFGLKHSHLLSSLSNHAASTGRKSLSFTGSAGLGKVAGNNVKQGVGEGRQMWLNVILQDIQIAVGAI